MSPHPTWLWDLLGVEAIPEGETLRVGGDEFVLVDGILRQRRLLSESQAQTADSFGFKWAKRETFESDAALARMREWLIERYGDVEKAEWWEEYGDTPIVLDAGCGAAMSSLELFGRRLENVHYLGCDVSSAIDVAADRLASRSLDPAFIQTDLMSLPLPDCSVDVIFSEGVLHHTDSTCAALLAVTRVLRPGGRILFYVYRRKGPIREFTDDYVRGRLQTMTPEEAWDAVLPITRLGKALGDAGVEIEVPEDIDLLGIPAGRIDVQRLFYWHVLKAFHHRDYSIDELNHINYDWFAPANAHRQTPEDVRKWCEDAELVVEREHVEDAGITIVAQRGA